MNDDARLKELATEIVDDLFMNGSGQTAYRLVLTSGDKRDLGGWGRLPAIDRVTARLVRSALRAPAGTQEGRPFCADDAHIFGPCQQCGMPYLASRLEPPTAADIAWAKRVIKRLPAGPASLPEGQKGES